MGREPRVNSGAEETGVDGSTCTECGSAQAVSTRITFEDGNETSLELCDECVAEYRSADLVAGVSQE